MSEFMQWWLGGVGVGLIVGVLLMGLLWRSQDDLWCWWNSLDCRVRGHHWRYVGMTYLDNTPADLRICTRCNLHEDVTHEEYLRHKGKEAH
jgi:hypothetical protein